MKVSIKDTYGNVVTTNKTTVTLSLGSTVSGVTLSGTLKETAVNGVATFASLSLNKIGTYTLVATDGSLTHGASSKFVIT